MESFYNISKTIEYLLVLKNISETISGNVAIKYFAIFYKDVDPIFQLKWKFRNIWVGVKIWNNGM